MTKSHRVGGFNNRLLFSHGSGDWKSKIKLPAQSASLRPLSLGFRQVSSHRVWHGLWVKWVSEVAQSCPILCYPMDCNLPGSSVHGIFQARILEWVAIAFSRRSSPTQGLNPGLPHSLSLGFRHVSSHRVWRDLYSLPMSKETTRSKLSGAPSCKGINPIVNISWPHLNRITSQRPHLQIPSHWCYRLNIWIGGGMRPHNSVDSVIQSTLSPLQRRKYAFACPIM